MTFVRSAVLTFVLVLGVLGIFMDLRAQQSTPAGITYEGQKVSSVEIAGKPELDTHQLKPLIAQPINAPYSQQKIDETIAALKKTGQFNDVLVDVRPQAAGLQVLFVLQPAIYFGMFDFGKATRVFTYSRLLQIASEPSQQPYTMGRVEEAESNLVTFFHRTGFFLATVEPKLQTDNDRGFVNVFFDVDLKRQAKFGKVTLTGASEAETQRLQKSLHSWTARLKGTSIRSGKPYSLQRLEKATTYLQTELGKRHFLAAQVKLISAVYDAQTNRADITFNVTQGPKITVTAQGAHVWGRTMRKLIPIYQENSVDPDLVEEGTRNLVSYFQGKGYFDVKVKSRIENQPSGTTVVYQIQRGSKSKVSAIDFSGNQRYDKDDLLPHVAVARGGFLSHGKFSEQLLHKSAKNLETFYQNNGYSQARVTPTAVKKNGKVIIAFQVQEGVQDIVESLKLEGNNSIPKSELAPGGFTLKPGGPYSAEMQDRDRDHIIATYLKRGFLTARFTGKATPEKADPHRVTVTYNIDEGPQVRTTMLTTLGAYHTRAEVIAKQVKIPVGQPLSEEALLGTESRLYTLGVFDWATVDPLKPVTTESDNQVLVKLHESKRNSITYGVGFEVLNRGGSVPGGTVALPNLPPVGLPSNFQTSQQTFWGPRGSLQYTRMNFLGRAETLSIGGLAARLDQRAGINWTDPAFLNSVWTSSVSLSAERTSENPIFTEKLVQGGFEVHRTLNRARTETLFLRYTLRRDDISNLLIPDLVPPEDRNVRLSTLTASFIRDTRDTPLDAHRGIYESFEVGLTPRFLGSSTSYARFMGQTAYYQRLGGNNIIWANSLRVGLELAYNGAHIPLSELFFSGGGSTLRGFPLDGAGPQRNVPVCGNPSDPSTCSQIRVPVGGAQLVILNSELRFPIPVNLPLIGNKLGGVGFYDGGNVYQTVGFQNFFSNYSKTLGFGLRYATPVGPVRVDLGHNLQQIPGVTKQWQLFITLGQAF